MRELLRTGAEPRLPEISLKELVGPDVSVRLLEAGGIRGNLRLQELLVINAVVSRFAPRTIFEIGTFDGRTTLNMAANAPIDAVVYTLDLPPGIVKLPTGVSIGMRFRDTEFEKKIVQLYGNSLSFDFSKFVSMIDLVFVDGDHRFEYVARDSKTAMELIGGKRGIILWHDYGFKPDVTRVVNELFSKFKDLCAFVAIKETWLACLMPVGDRTWHVPTLTVSTPRVT